MKKKLKEKDIFMVAVLIALLVFVTSKHAIPEPLSPITSSTWDISNEVSDSGLSEFLVETADFDYSNENVYKLAQQIKSSTATPYDSIKKTAKYVVSSIDYSSKISVSYCYEETASKVLATGKGDCVSMSRLVTALLRAQGIPARTVGGCLTSSRSCTPLFAAIPSFEARTTPMAYNDFKKRGFLHEWVEVYDVSTNGWLLVESTSGQVFKLNCDSYLMYHYDTNKYDRCTIDSQSFWQTCNEA